MAGRLGAEQRHFYGGVFGAALWTSAMQLVRVWPSALVVREFDRLREGSRWWRLANIAAALHGWARVVVVRSGRVLACGLGKLMGVETTELFCVSIARTEQQVRLCSIFCVGHSDDVS